MIDMNTYVLAADFHMRQLVKSRRYYHSGRYENRETIGGDE